MMSLQANRSTVICSESMCGQLNQQMFCTVGQKNAPQRHFFYTGEKICANLWVILAQPWFTLSVNVWIWSDTRDHVLCALSSRLRSDICPFSLLSLQSTILIMYIESAFQHRLFLACCEISDQMFYAFSIISYSWKDPTINYLEAKICCLGAKEKKKHLFFFPWRLILVPCISTTSTLLQQSLWSSMCGKGKGVAWGQDFPPKIHTFTPTILLAMGRNPYTLPRWEM